MTTLNAITASDFLGTLGINTHIDFDAYGYQNLAIVEAAINYLGVKNIRDSAQTPSDVSAWLQVAQATGAKFDDFIGQTSPAGMLTDLGYAAQLAQEGVLNAIEGGDEEDDSYPASLGNTLQITALFQQQVYALAQQYGLPTINMSFGAGWTAANDWQGDYATVGDLSGIANYANAHTYPNPGQTPDSAIQQLNADALLAAAGRPVMTTEIGWNTDTFSPGAVAQYVVQAALDGIKDGDASMYYYALFDDMSGNFGLMNADGSPTPAGTALHDLTTLLADTGGSFTPGSLSFTLNGAESGDNTLLIQKSDGSDWLALWNETAGAHQVTLSLAAAASQIEVFDPVTGTAAIASAANTGSITVSLGNDPLLIEIVPGGSSADTGSDTGSESTAVSGSDPTSAATAGPDPVLTLPAAESVAAGSTTAIPGISLADAWAATNPGTLTLNLTASAGTLSMTDQSGNPLAGSGSGAISVNGTLAQINAWLGTLSFTAGSDGDASIAVDVWDQSGAATAQSIDVTVGGSTTTASTTIAAGNPDAVELLSNTAITASAGDHLIFIGGTGDTLTARGGTETVQAFQGGNTLTTGAGNDQIYLAGAGNVVDAGGGNNTLFDSGSNNTIVLPGAGQGYDDIYGNVMTNGDTFDMRGLLASTGWNGDAATVGNYVSVAQSGNNAVISGAGAVVATLEGTGPVSLSTLLTHAIT